MLLSIIASIAAAYTDTCTLTNQDAEKVITLLSFIQLTLTLSQF